MFRRTFILLAAFAASICPAYASAQAAVGARLIATVIDPDRAVVPGASVLVVGLDDSTKRVGVPQVTSNDRGIATFENLTPGRYSVQVTLPGFDFGLLRDVTLRRGDNRHAVVLPLRRVTESVTVGGGQEGASSRSTATFGTTVGRDAIDTLADDPAELQRQLLELAGPEAVIRVDSFEGGTLPPKSQIKSVHVTRDQFAAEADYPGTTFVDVITQPGTGALSGTFNMTSRSMAMAGVSPFVGTAPSERNNQYNATVGGTLIRNRSDFSINVQAQDRYSLPIFKEAGKAALVLDTRQSFQGILVNTLMNVELPRNQTLRLGYSNLHQYERGLGIGQYDSLDRAARADYSGFRFIVQEAGAIGRRLFLNTRLQTTTTDEVRRSELEAPTTVIQGARTFGGAQIGGRTDRTNVQLASDLDYIRGIHSWRTGIQVQADWYDSSMANGYLGTYTFKDEPAYAAGTPLLYTRTIGDPRVKYFNATTALYVQDDIRVKKSLTFSPGVRYMMQTHVNDWRGLAPRFGVTWAPFASGKTTFRTSAGLFYWPLEMPRVYEQTLRLDGNHQQEVILLNPTYPDPGVVQGAPPNKYLLGDYNLQRNVRYSGGIDHTFSSRVRANVLYSFTHQFALWRGLNLNAPVDGVRPDPNFANVIQAVTDGNVRRHDVSANLNVSMVSPAQAGQVRFNWKRMSVAASYSMLHGRQNSEAPFVVPPSGSLDSEWGRMPGDQPYRVNIQLTSTQLRNLNANLSWTTNSGSPYTLTTGIDDNQDGLLNDRPAGVAPRTLRTASFASLNMRAAYTLMTPAGQARRYRIGLTFNASNLTNRTNYGGYSGNLLSEDFMTPTFVSNPRRVDLGLTLGF